MRRVTAALVLVLPGIASLATLPDTSAAAGGVLCQGQPVTIVGVPGEDVDGTSGADVIDVNGATITRGRGGDDVICLTGGSTYTVYGGEGADAIEVDDSGYLESNILPGGGDDTVVGGPGRDEVFLDATSSDTVTTLGGDDNVEAGSRFGPMQGVPAHDVDLGEGDDRLLVGNKGVADAVRLEGGAGDDELYLYFAGSTMPIRVDASVREVWRGEQLKVQDWAGFERHTLGFDSGSDPSTDTRGPVTIVGTHGADRFRVAKPARLDVRLLGGDDSIVVGRGGRIGGTVDGGAGGRDEVLVEGFDEGLLVDLAAGVVLEEGRSERLRLSRFEDATSLTRGATLRGDDGANRLRSECGHVVAGGGSDRVLEGVYVVESGTFAPGVRCPAYRAEGGRGDDVLLGSLGTDTLLGGPGRDRADGRAGRDTCVAERRVRCER